MRVGHVYENHFEQVAEQLKEEQGVGAPKYKAVLTYEDMLRQTAAAMERSPTVIREATTMRRQVDHHLARARAIGRRARTR